MGEAKRNPSKQQKTVSKSFVGWVKRSATHQNSKKQFQKRDIGKIMNTHQKKRLYLSAQWQQKRARGFTLIELIIVILILGIIGGMVAVFLRHPIQQYGDSVRRARLTDVADFATRSMARELRNALPNSIRISGENTIEFVPILMAGRYRADFDPAHPKDCVNDMEPTAGFFPLFVEDVGEGCSEESGFSAIGPVANFVPFDDQNARHQYLVIGNLGIAGANVYEPSTRLTSGNGIRADEAWVRDFPLTEHYVQAAQLDSLPAHSPTNRFFITGNPITYQCLNNEVRRYNNYGFFLNQPTSAADLTTGSDGNDPSFDCTKVIMTGAGNICTPTQGIVATNVSSCRFTKSADGSLVTLRIDISENNGATTETVRLQHQINVDNTP